MSPSGRLFWTFALPVAGIVFAALIPAPALAGFCTSLSDCVQNDQGGGRLLLTASGVVGGTVLVLMGEDFGPSGGGGHFLATPEDPCADHRAEVDRGETRIRALEAELEQALQGLEDLPVPEQPPKWIA